MGNYNNTNNKENYVTIRDDDELKGFLKYFILIM